MWYEPKEKTLHSGSAATGNGQIFDLEGKYGALRLQVIGITSATITFEQSNNGGTTWDGIAGVNTETGAKVTTTTADGTFLFPIPGVKKFRARISTYVTGTINVYAVAVPADVASMEVILSSGDVEIGAVELKNATTDDRAIITAGGEVYTDTRKIAGVTPQFDDTDKFAVSVYGKSTAAGDTPLLVDATGHVQVDVVGALPAGSAIIGKTGIDQTTPGTTNGVQVNAALPAGTNVIGQVSINQTTDGTTNKVHAHSSAADDFLANANLQLADADVSATNPVPTQGRPIRAAGVLHRNGITAIDKLVDFGDASVTGADQATGGSLAFNTAYKFTVIPGNRYGPTTVPTNIDSVTTANDANNTHAMRVTIAQCVSAEWYDIFLSTDAAPKWVARVTEAQRAAGDYEVTAVGTVAAGGGNPAGTIDVNVVGTGIQTSNSIFAQNNAYTPAAAGIVAVDCSNRTKAYIHVALVLADLRSAPALRVIPFLRNSVDTTIWHQGSVQIVSVLTGLGLSLYQAFEVEMNDADQMVVLIDSISGQAAAASIWVELV